MSQRSEEGSVTLDEVREHARAVHRRQGWGERTPPVRMLYLMSEVGELAKASIALETKVLSTDDAVDAIGDELFDILWNVCALANTLDIDLNSAARRKLAVMENRTWQKGQYDD